MDHFMVCASPVGRILIASDGRAVTRLQVVDEGSPDDPGMCEDAVLHRAKEALGKYFKGEAPDEVPLAPHGTVYQERVWSLLRRIPYGQTTSYGAVAKQYEETYGDRTSPRAIGGAVGKNPIWILIPCHRVIGKDGNLTGYAGGLAVKRMLLEREGVKK